MTQDPYAIAVLNDSPTVYYRLDDTGTIAVDSSGGGHNATVGSAVTESASGLLTSSQDTAMTFPGTKASTGVVSTASIAALQPTTAVSLEAWMRFSATPALYTTAVAYGNDNNYAPYDLYFAASGKLAAQFFLNSGAVVATSPTALKVSTTYHVVSTYDGTTAKLYVNGTLVASAAKTGTLAGYDSHGVGIGDDAAISNPAFKGTLDDVAIYAGNALTATQVANHYNAGIGNGPPPTPTPSPTPQPTPTSSPNPTFGSGYWTAVLNDRPTVYYHLNDTGKTASDASGNGLNATIGGAVTISAQGLLPTSTDAAMSFPGTKSLGGIVAGNANAQLQPSSTVSIEAWLRFSTTPSLYTVPVAYGNDNNYAPYDLYFVSGGKIIAQFYLTTGVLLVASPTAMQPNTTYYVVSTFDGTNGRLYVNGILVASATKSGTLSGYDSHGVGIGDDTSLSDPAFAGTIDEVAIYSGKALTQAQVQTHYNAGVGNGPPPTPTPPPTPGVDWDTFGVDLPRTGYNPTETQLGVNNAGNLQPLWPAKANIGYGMVGEPVLAEGVAINGQTRNVLYAGSNFGTVFSALDADTGATLWTHAVSTAPYTCDGSTSTFGVAGTPVIDRPANRIYFVDGQNNLHALDLATGSEAPSWPIIVADVTPDHNFAYGGLTYNPANHMLYVPTSSTCDISPWYGRITAINTGTATIVGTFFPAQGTSGGGIWGYGGASIDPATNDVFVATGNSDGPSQTIGYSEQIVELSPDVKTVLASNLPTLPVSGDADFGATPLLFQPPGCPPLLAAVNKSGEFVLYNRYNIAAGPTQEIDMSIATDAGDFIGVPAYDPVTNYVYVGLPSTFGIYQPGLGAFSMSNCALNPTPVWNAVFGPDGAMTSDDTPRSALTIANGVIYVSNFSGMTEFAFNAASGAQLWSTALSDYGIPGAVVSNGHLYVSSYDGTIMEWGPSTGNMAKHRLNNATAVRKPVHRHHVKHKIPYLNQRHRHPR